MRIGSLVVTKSRWGMDSRLIGLVVEQTSTGNDTWIVLWSTKHAYKLQEHSGTGLLEVAETKDDEVSNS